jgi:predicted acylesterase/phospholipase RssA
MKRTTQLTRFFQSCFGVFQGGGCRGAAFVGAIQEAKARGVDFAGVAGTSAGSIVAALLGAGATPEYLEEALKGLDFMRLLQPPDEVREKAALGERCGLFMARRFFAEVARVWEFHGLYSSAGLERWMNLRLAELVPVKPPIKFRHLPIPTYVVAADIFTNEVKTFSNVDTESDDVAFAVRCSCSIPGFFQPVIGRYIDGGVLSNLPAFVFSRPEFDHDKPLANRILAFTLVQKRAAGEQPSTRGDLFRATVNTVIDGASAIQSRLMHSVHEIRIDTGDVQATDFDKMDVPKISWMVEQGRIAARAFFEDELGQVRSSRAPANRLSGDDEVYTSVVEALDEPGIRSIVISDFQTRWAYSIFPALLAWRMRGVRLQIVLGAAPADDHEHYRRRLLSALGADVYSVEQALAFRGFLLNPDDQALARAVVFVPEGAVPDGTALRYDAPFDLPVIQSLYAGLPAVIKAQANMASPPQIVGIPEQQVSDKLRRYVKAYSTAGVKIAMETVPISKMISLSRIVRGYKYKQISPFFEMFKAAKLDWFETVEVRYSPKLSTLITPPVLEFTGDRYVLVQGNTRAAFCHKNGIDEMRCYVVRGHMTPLPADQRVELKNVLIGGRTLSVEDRYGGAIDKDYRAIEWATHHPKETLLND